MFSVRHKTLLACMHLQFYRLRPGKAAVKKKKSTSARFNKSVNDTYIDGLWGGETSKHNISYG